MTQKEIIKKLLTNDWTPSYKLLMVNTPYGWLGSQADRRARELACDGEIERKIDGKYVYYRLPQNTINTKTLKTEYNEVIALR